MHIQYFKNLKNFILFAVKLGLILMLVVYAYKGLFWYLWEYENGPRAYDKAYQHALYLQYQQIANPDRDNEIIFFGSSTCAFGIDVDTVEELTGQKAQIFGVESAIGPDFLTKELTRIAKPGDTVVYVFDSMAMLGESLINVSCAMEDDKEFLKRYWKEHKYDFNIQKSTLCWRKLYSLLIGNAVEKVRSSISSKDQVYMLSSFNEDGNMNLERYESSVATVTEPYIELKYEDINPKLFTKLNEFDEWCKANDVTFVVAYNMSPEGAYINDKESLEEFDRQIREALTAPVIIKPEDGLFPAEDFYNMEYHLNTNGARKYTKKIVEGRGFCHKECPSGSP